MRRLDSATTVLNDFHALLSAVILLYTLPPSCYRLYFLSATNPVVRLLLHSLLLNFLLLPLDNLLLPATHIIAVCCTLKFCLLHTMLLPSTLYCCLQYTMLVHVTHPAAARYTPFCCPFHTLSLPAKYPAASCYTPCCYLIDTVLLLIAHPAVCLQTTLSPFCYKVLLPATHHTVERLLQILLPARLPSIFC